MLITTYYSVIGDEVTYRIGLLLSRYALCVKELCDSLDLPQPHVSHKLAKLRKHDYVQCHRDGKRVIYRFSEPWRSILLHGDIGWRKLNPEMAPMWSKDMTLLREIVGDDLEARQVHPIITGPPHIPNGKSSGHPQSHPHHTGS